MPADREEVPAGIVGGVERQRAAWMVTAAAVAAVFGLLLPWAASGTRSRSSIELLSSANALDVLSALERWALLGVWFGVVVAVAVGLVAVAWHRIDLGALAFAAVGPALVVAVVIVCRSPLSPEWGAYTSSGLGLVASIGSGMLLARRSVDEGSRR